MECDTGKTCYGTKEEALAAGRAVRALPEGTRRHEHPPRAVYLGECCGWWHLTSKTKGKPYDQFIDPMEAFTTTRSGSNG